MDLITREALRDLAETEQDPCVSIYMPTARVEAQQSQNPIRLKNLLKRAHKELEEKGLRDGHINQMLGPVQALLDDADFWLHPSDGMAIFVTEGIFEVYRLPLEFEELVVTGQHFHLKPLFPLIATNNRFYMLALSKKSVNVYMGTHFAISEVHVPDMPKSISDALWMDDTQKTQQFHTGTKNNKGRETLMSHGHNVGRGDDEAGRPHDDLVRFFQQIDEALRTRLREETAPLLLAGVEYYLPIYRDTTKYQHLVENQIIGGNPDRLNLKELHAKAWEIMEPIFLEAQQEAIEQFRQQLGTGVLASDDLKEIIPAAIFGRVDTLFVPIGKHVWGRYDQDANTVEIHDEHLPGDEDLLNVATVFTYLNGGTVHALREENMPVENALAATYRYEANVSASEV